jgi:hypothetical protein
MSEGAGGVGAVGSAGGAGSGAPAGQGSVSAGKGAAPSELSSPGSAEGKDSAKEVSDDGAKVGITNISQTQSNNSIYSNMSTQDSMELHSCVNESGGGEMDIQKLIELMMMMKLMEAMNESDGGGFSTTA